MLSCLNKRFSISASLGEITALPRPVAGGSGLTVPPQESRPGLGPSGLAASPRNTPPAPENKSQLRRWQPINFLLLLQSKTNICRYLHTNCVCVLSNIDTVSQYIEYIYNAVIAVFVLSSSLYDTVDTNNNTISTAFVKHVLAAWAASAPPAAILFPGCLLYTSPSPRD